MMPRAALAKARGGELDRLFDGIASGMIASKGHYQGPLQILNTVKANMVSIETAILNRREHNQTKASRDRIAEVIATSMSKLIELSVREGVVIGERVAGKA